MTIENETEKRTVRIAVDIALKLGLLALVLYVSYLIVNPFLSIILWGIVLAVAFSPMIGIIERRLGGHRKKIIIGISLLAAVGLITPTVMISSSLINSSHRLMQAVEKKTIDIPHPSEKVKSWPLVGKEIYRIWKIGYEDLHKAILPFKKMINRLIVKLAALLKGGLTAVLLSVVSVGVAAAFLISEEKGVALYRRIMQRLVGERGEEWTTLSARTVRGVAIGVVGVAVIQSALALAGMLAMGIPLAPVWALVILFATIIQLPTLVVTLPIMGYALSVYSGTPVYIFTVYMIFVSFVNDILKPILMGRGVEIPMLVILIGAIGGMMLMGMLGLFLGAVILALSYKLFELWMLESSLPERSGTKEQETLV